MLEITNSIKQSGIPCGLSVSALRLLDDQGQDGEYKEDDWVGVERLGAGVEGTVGALVGAAHLADTEDVERGGIECLHIELLWPQRLYDHRRQAPS